MAKKKSTKLRGSKRMREFGYKAVSVWLDKSEQELIDKAARAAGVPVATYLRLRAVAAAAAELGTAGPKTGYWREHA